MFVTTTRDKPKYERLRTLIMKAGSFRDAVSLALELHALVHLAEISASTAPMYEDSIWENLTDTDFSAAPTPRSFPIAWHIWHITRIEDLVGNILIKNAQQVFDTAWADRVGAPVTDTGNAMTADEARRFSEKISPSELKRYRIAVGQRTREIINGLEPGDMRKKPCQQSLDRLLAEGGLTEHEKSFWLRDFWGGRTFAGLILLPLTRHQLMHLEPCEKMKEVIQALKA